MEVVYEDNSGRNWTVLIPENDREHPEHGIPLGPPDISSLGLPENVEVALHNQLNSRRIFNYEDAKRRLTDLEAALKAALRVDAMKILDALR